MGVTLGAGVLPTAAHHNKYNAHERSADWVLVCVGPLLCPAQAWSGTPPRLGSGRSKGSMTGGIPQCHLHRQRGLANRCVSLPPLAVSLTLCPCFCLCAFVDALSCCVCVKCKPRTVTNPARARNLLSGTQCTPSQTGRGSMPRCTCSSCWILNPDRKPDPNGKSNCGWFMSLKLVMSNLPTALDSSQTAFSPLDLRDLQQLPAFTF